MEAILEIVAMLIFRYPGAFLRWIFIRKKRSFKSILEDDAAINGTLSITVLALIIAFVKLNF